MGSLKPLMQTNPKSLYFKVSREAYQRKALQPLQQNLWSLHKEENLGSQM